MGDRCEGTLGALPPDPRQGGDPLDPRLLAPLNPQKLWKRKRAKVEIVQCFSFGDIEF